MAMPVHCPYCDSTRLVVLDVLPTEKGQREVYRKLYSCKGCNKEFVAAVVRTLNGSITKYPELRDTVQHIDSLSLEDAFEDELVLKDFFNENE
ncbi:MAG TPA: hypothetical protein ENG51_09400 [Deltaproteobacteria bacterium]|nr:hypothetical protein [Deltaproteobacteria bacterium]